MLACRLFCQSVNVACVLPAARDSASPQPCPGGHHGHCAPHPWERSCSQDFGITAVLPPFAPVCFSGVEMGPGASHFVDEQPQAEPGQLGQSWGRLPIRGR